MKKILAFLEKINTPLCYSILAGVFGLAFLLLPSIALDILLIVSGVALIFVGVIKVVSLDIKNRTLEYYFSLGVGLCIIGFGILLVSSRQNAGALPARAVGIYILIRAAIEAYRLLTRDVERNLKWGISLSLYILECIAALTLALLPVPARYMTGAILLVICLDLVFRIFKKKGSGAGSDFFKHGNDPDTFYDPHFEDRSDG